MPLFDQSVARQVGFDLSNMRTPFSISLMITAFDSSNSWSSSSVHVNGESGLRAFRKGSMRSVAAKAYETWLISPNQERMSVTLVGLGKWRMASRYFWHGRTWLFVISKPANSTLSSPNTNFSGLRVIPFCPQMSSQLTAW